MKYTERYITLDEYQGKYLAMNLLYEGFVIGYGYVYYQAKVFMPPHMSGYGTPTERLYGNGSHCILGTQRIEDRSIKAVKLSLRGLFKDGEAVVTVNSGMTLSGIAALFDVTVEDLVRWNNIENSDRIFVGQKIRIIDKIQSHIVGNTKISDATFSTSNKKSPQSIFDVNGVSTYDKIIAGVGVTATFVQQSNTSFYINSINELVTFSGTAPSGATSVANIGRSVGRGALGVSIVLDYVKYKNDQITGENFIFNTSFNTIGYCNPYLGVPYTLTEIFYPGGFKQAMIDRFKLEEERRKAMGNTYLPLSVKSYQ